MTPKERIFTAINHKEPDKVPKFSSFTPEFANKLRKHFNLEKDSFDPRVVIKYPLDEVLEKSLGSRAALVNAECDKHTPSHLERVRSQACKVSYLTTIPE